ncbi:MAG: hypothetical protein HYT87_13040 [Nitrospirae bacterium]|nr:hypothetical protein [Nitrospirota bacterium]
MAKTGAISRILNGLIKVPADPMSEQVWEFLRMEPSAGELIKRGDEILQAVRTLERRVGGVEAIIKRIQCTRAIPSKTTPPGL